MIILYIFFTHLEKKKKYEKIPFTAGFGPKYKQNQWTLKYIHLKIQKIVYTKQEFQKRTGTSRDCSLRFPVTQGIPNNLSEADFRFSFLFSLHCSKKKKKIRSRYCSKQSTRS